MVVTRSRGLELFPLTQFAFDFLDMTSGISPGLKALFGALLRCEAAHSHHVNISQHGGGILTLLT